MAKKIKYEGTEEREVPGLGVYKPGDVVESNDILLGTGLFSTVEEKKKGKGEE